MTRIREKLADWDEEQERVMARYPDGAAKALSTAVSQLFHEIVDAVENIQQTHALLMKPTYFVTGSEEMLRDEEQRGKPALWWQAQARVLRSEVDCRIEHGAESGGHLEYVRGKLDETLKAGSPPDEPRGRTTRDHIAETILGVEEIRSGIGLPLSPIGALREEVARLKRVEEAARGVFDVEFPHGAQVYRSAMRYGGARVHAAWTELLEALEAPKL